ncbi:MAG: hypothetical protein MUP70_13190 [Candidatus Aminicenantes bacterium]|nr:hypothetical protein [Candidatus Aminicenantes bacterium]
MSGGKRLFFIISGYKDHDHVIGDDDNKVHEVHLDYIHLIYPSDMIPINIRKG